MIGCELVLDIQVCSRGGAEDAEPEGLLFGHAPVDDCSFVTKKPVFGEAEDGKNKKQTMNTFCG